MSVRIVAYTARITCDTCGKHQRLTGASLIDIAAQCDNHGWLSTDHDTYCSPECARKAHQ